VIFIAFPVNESINLKQAPTPAETRYTLPSHLRKIQASLAGIE